MENENRDEYVKNAKMLAKDYWKMANKHSKDLKPAEFCSILLGLIVGTLAHTIADKNFIKYIINESLEMAYKAYEVNENES